MIHAAKEHYSAVAVQCRDSAVQCRDDAMLGQCGVGAVQYGHSAVQAQCRTGKVQYGQAQCNAGTVLCRCSTVQGQCSAWVVQCRNSTAVSTIRFGFPDLGPESGPFQQKGRILLKKVGFSPLQSGFSPRSQKRRRTNVCSCPAGCSGGVKRAGLVAAC